MRRLTSWTLGALGVTVLVASCGGGTTSIGGGDASASSSGSSSGGSSASGSSSGTSNGTSSGTSSGSSSGASGSSGSSSSGSGGQCNPACTGGLACCNGRCVNEGNDPTNCGHCGVTCTGATPYCGAQGCAAPPCEQDAATCAGGGECCGRQCCGAGEICCQMDEGVSITECYAPPDGGVSCPVGCPMCVSDRNVKRDVTPVDPGAVLDAVTRMPVSTWSYKKDDPSVRHMGPMAQDLYAAFGLGGTDKAYSPVDAHGLAFAAIQGLARRMEEQDARIDRLEKENAELRRGAATCR